MSFYTCVYNLKKKNVANQWNVDQPLSLVLGFRIDNTEAAVSREPKYHSWLGGNIYMYVYTYTYILIDIDIPTPVTPDEPANLGTTRQPL